MGVFAFIIMIVALVTFGEVASKWLDGSRSRPEIEPGADPDEVEQLRAQVESLTDQVERLTEEQRFMTRLLESAAGRDADGETRSD